MSPRRSRHEHAKCWAAVAALLLGGLACSGSKQPSLRADGTNKGTAECPDTRATQDPLPGVTKEQRTAAYWIGRMRDADAPVMGPGDIASHNRALTLPFEGEPLGRMDLAAAVDQAWLLSQLQIRFAYLRERLANGTYLTAKGEKASDAILRAVAEPTIAPQVHPRWHVATAPMPMFCAPFPEPLYTKELDPHFDRNLCTTIRAQDLVEVLADQGDLSLARTSSALGWIRKSAPLSPAMTEAERSHWFARPRVQAVNDTRMDVGGGQTVDLAAGTLLPTTDDGTTTFVADARGIHALPTPASLRNVQRPFTRRAFFEEAFTLLNTPYGWGGRDGGRDCSQFLLDIFERFGVDLPRNSARQAIAGTFVIDVSQTTDLAKKQSLMALAAKHGIVLLHFPGHIMLYLGESEDGRAMVLHSFSEYLDACAGGGETRRLVDRNTVSDLSLGKGTSKRSFLERITKITVVGQPPDDGLAGAAVVRAAAPITAPPAVCTEAADAPVFRSPARPHVGAALRVIAPLASSPGAADLFVFDPAGARVAITTHRLAGPPHTLWSSMDAPKAGTYTVVVADGANTVTCERIHVSRGPSGAPPRDAALPLPAWEGRGTWDAGTENLYAAFVAQLFAYPFAEDLTWKNLQSLLQDPAHNLLLNHRGADEDSTLVLEPDCADLPYFLRAYFAWKLGLPFAFRHCSRGRTGAPPQCGEPVTNLAPVTGASEVDSFKSFMRLVGQGVHSATARTVPTDESTDVYPVALTREALKPGTVFADPYGHLLVIAEWIPQGVDSYGVLVGAEAQPDGTIGRRRFWQGTFLFDPSTKDVGAGFKAWRPVAWDAKAQTMTFMTNEDLDKTKGHTRRSTEQYDGTKADFYDKVEALINPRPLDPVAAQGALVDALYEGAVRRILSVDNGLDSMNKTGWKTVAMPQGYDIFETEGAWEDFATPARDLRLLIAIDTVTGFADAVARAPARFGVADEDVSAVVARVRDALAAELKTKTFEYTKSDGQKQRLSLADVVARKAAFEMSYNPNDCAEIRWGAEAATDNREMATCNHHAPPAQRALMQSVRGWFQNRQRPAR